MSTTQIPDLLELSPRQIIAGFPAPALLVDKTGAVLAANAPAEGLVRAIQKGLVPQVRELTLRLVETLQPQLGRAELSGEDMETALDITVLPILTSRNRLRYGLVLTRESTLERNFITALVSSRQLFKDLVGCSSDFAWETRPDGTFAFVSRRGALGYTARELYGRAPDSMLLNAMNSATLESPFRSHTAREDVEVWVEDAHARPACLLVSCVPAFDAQGNWTGTRGVCRDVTEERELTAALETARNRERLLGQVVDSIRTEIEPPAMLGAAARAVASTLRASHCWIVRARNGRFTGAQQAAGLDGPPENRLVDVVNAQLRGTKEELFVKVNDRTLHVIANVSRYHDTINGAICVARPEDGEHWTDDDRILLTGVGDHLGIAIAQIENREQLEELSRTDELTQLFNRRAFADEVGMRLRALRRTERKAALFYVDLDNFKRVNDVHGHKRGDEALLAVAKLLVENSRAGDIIARLGGDEFAMWLEETDAQAGHSKAMALLRLGPKLRAFSGDEAHPLGISIGVAVTDPSQEEPLVDLLARADGAMYVSKRGGKGRYALSSAPGQPIIEQPRKAV